jgi:hypothetical protein
MINKIKKFFKPELSPTEIQQKLTDKLNLLYTELPLPIFTLIKEHGYFAGGCIRSLLTNDEPKDYDIFFKDEESLNLIKNNEYLKRYFTTNNSINMLLNGVKFQIITLECGFPETVISKFDFTFNQNYFVFSNKALFIKDKESIINKIIEINYDCRNSFDTCIRIEKFLNRGYKLKSDKEMYKIATRITQLDPVTTKQQFKTATRHCASSLLDSGKVDFLD